MTVCGTKHTRGLQLKMVLLFLTIVHALYLVRQNISNLGTMLLYDEVVNLSAAFSPPSTVTETSVVKTLVEDSSRNEEDYISWLQEQRNQTNSFIRKTQPLIVLYRGCAGLGHQLLRMSSAYYLALMYKIPRIWPTASDICGGDFFTLYNTLIGPGQLLVDVPFFSNNNLYRNRSLFPLPPNWPNMVIMANMTNNNNNNMTSESTTTTTTKVQQLEQEMIFENNVPGFKTNLQKYLSSNDNNIYNKDLTDYQLYHQLMVLFEHKHRNQINTVLNYTRFEHHTVFGLHIRTGNGEQKDFKWTGRDKYINDWDQWIMSTMELFCDYKKQHNETYFSTKPLMIYVGTDTGSIISKLQNASEHSCKIPIVSADQAYPEDGIGHFALQKNLDPKVCLQGWIDMFLDMYMFTRCNTVVTGAYSSFTQAAPLSIIMNKAAAAATARRLKTTKAEKEEKKVHPHYFCEIGPNGRRIDCFNMLKGWIKRKPTLVWGDFWSPSQVHRSAFMFPQLGNSNVISRHFKGTVMMEVNETKH